jgi:hypothetical protein
VRILCLHLLDLTVEKMAHLPDFLVEGVLHILPTLLAYYNNS